MTDTVRPMPKKRRRPALACMQCRARKVRCDRTSPCNNCVRYKNAECTYASASPPRVGLATSRFDSAEQSLGEARDNRRVPSAHSDRDEAVVVTPQRLRTTQPSFAFPIAVSGDDQPFLSPITFDSDSYRRRGSVEPTPEASVSTRSLLQKIHRLETQLEDRCSCHGSARTHLDSIAGTEAGESGCGALPVRNVHHKTRLFGQSHCMSGAELFTVLIETFIRAMKKPNSVLRRADEECKRLGRAIKAQRIPILVFPLMQVGQAIGQKYVADSLIECYLRTFETIHRVVHIPRFRAEYERYWGMPSSADPAFVIMTQLCMAIGACFLDDEYSMRSSAVRWICEAEVWLASPSGKTRMTFTGLQVMCLLRTARQMAGVGADLTWISVGNLMRTAMYMGLHRDPRRSGIQTATRHRVEMRRRLWATILEIALQASIDAGGPPFISGDDFDTEPPGNFDDDQLISESTPEKHSGTYTQTSVQIALLESFPIRLAIAKAVNEFRSGLGYNELLRLDTQLQHACQGLQQQLSGLERDESGVHGVSEFQLRTTQLLTLRFFFALHVPLFGLSLTKPAYYFSRKMCLDISLKICQISGFLPAAGCAASIPADFDRLVTSASGLRRTAVFQSIMVAAIELITRKEERKTHGFSVSLGDSELRAVLEAAVGWAERSIKAGETNCKGYASLRAILTHLDALDSGLGMAELEETIDQQVAGALSECYEMMKATEAGRAVEMTSELHGGQGIELEVIEDYSWGMGMLDEWEDLMGESEGTAAIFPEWRC